MGDTNKTIGTPRNSIGGRIYSVSAIEQLRRSNSCSTPEDDRKRKRGETTPHKEEILKKKENPTAFVLLETLNMIKKHIEDLSKKIEENPNTKREIKDIALALRKQKAVLLRDTTREWLEEHRWEVFEMPKYDVESQTEEAESSKLEQQINALEAKIAEMAEEKEVIRKELEEAKQKIETLQNHENRTDSVSSVKGINTYEGWKLIERHRWDDNIYIRSEIKVGNPLETKDSVVKVVIVEPEDLERNISIQKIYRDRFPELMSVDEDFEVLEQITRTRTKERGELAQRKIIKVTYDGTEQNLWDQLQKVKDETAANEWVALHHVKNMTVQNMRKMVECVFQETETKVCIYTTKQTVAPEKIRERKTYGLVVEQKGKDFVNTIANVKAAINTNRAGDSIKSLKSTKDGKLLIITEKNDEAISEIRHLINQLPEKVNIKTVGKMSTKGTSYRIRVMDATTEKEEVIESLERTLGKKHGVGFRIGDLRPNTGNTKAATVMINDKEDESKMEKGIIRIGLVSCQVEQTVEVRRCYKCWTYDHTENICEGPDRRNLCYRCGKAGHSLKECQNEEECPICNKTGHKAGSGKCTLFKRALSRAKENIRSERQEQKCQHRQEREQRTESMEINASGERDSKSN
ncbi:hypothetical protein Zmor_005998 [Zophobas morio]|uniref:CCHC-type domain-containing protein n=1 Tax=Zophobas morio TaxID=2755281 RepID=A0AA38ML15_9CUCU|nr:hypothetical protein Zmor_005998 [Zophobas morio]